MSKKRNQIVYIPYPTKQNKNNESQITIVKILERKYKVCKNLATFNNVKEMVKTKAVFLNWVEEILDNKMKLQLILYQLFGAEIIWVFHNKIPHDRVNDKKSIHNMRWLADISNIIWLYSQNSQKYIPNKRDNQKKSVFIPHVMYKSQSANIDLTEVQKKYGVLETDFVFIIFGLIRPYKNIEEAIETFKKLKLLNAKLMIAGSPVNKEYAEKIKAQCMSNPDIILDLHHLSNRQLDSIIGISDVALLAYDMESSMNSGVMIQAFSNGKTVISPDICMARDFAKEGFIYRYQRSLEVVMKRAYMNGKEVNKKMGEQALQYVKEKHNEEEVARQLFQMLKMKER